MLQSGGSAKSVSHAGTHGSSCHFLLRDVANHKNICPSCLCCILSPPCLLVLLLPPSHSSPGDGKCVICDSFVRPCNLVHICDECNYGSFEGRCVVCGGVGVSDAYYCRECVQQEKDRDGCPKIVNLGSTKTDLFYERKKYGFKKR